LIFIPSSHLDEPEHVKRSMYAPLAGSIDWQLDAVARRDARIRELNRPPTPSPEFVVGDAVPETPAVKPRKLTELQKAKTFLADVLSGEPMLATMVEKLAVEKSPCFAFSTMAATTSATFSVGNEPDTGPG
jgi:hypothetical protein